MLKSNWYEEVKILKNWEQLEEYGINALTGEACGYAMRLLCDLNEDGKKLMVNFFGGNIEFRENSNWNSKVNGKEAIASIMLTRRMFEDIAKFCLLTIDNFTYVHTANTGFGYNVIYGANQNLNERSMINKITHTILNTGKERNVHTFSGRMI